MARRSSGVGGGIMVGIRFAAIDLPDPGGPIISRLCIPLQATSMARRRARCPLISEKSGSPAVGVEEAMGSGAIGGGAGPPESSRQASPSASIRWTQIPSTRAASSADIPGSSNMRFPILLARRAIASAPRMGRVDPDRLSSPAIRQSSAISSCSWRLAARSARAIGKS